VIGFVLLFPIVSAGCFFGLEFHAQLSYYTVMKRQRTSSSTDNGVVASGGAAQPSAPTGVAPPGVVTRTVAVHEMSLCYPCAVGKEIKKHVLCAECGQKRNTLLEVASPELWAEKRASDFCDRCASHFEEGSNGVYVFSRSVKEWGNMPICCACYGVDARTIPKNGLWQIAESVCLLSQTITMQIAGVLAQLWSVVCMSVENNFAPYRTMSVNAAEMEQGILPGSSCAQHVCSGFEAFKKDFAWIGFCSKISLDIAEIEQGILPGSSFVQYVGSVFETNKNTPGDSAWVRFCCKCIRALQNHFILPGSTVIR
jgi:hypothetical protein